MNLSIVIPVYNEGEQIEGLLTDIEKYLGADSEILLGYDFDEDSTLPPARKFLSRLPALRLIKNTYGRGPLGAIRSGFDAASHEAVLVMMGDRSDDLADVKIMLDLFSQGCEVVAASRYMLGGKQIGGPFLKRMLSRLAGNSLHFLAGIPTHDATNNFKLYSRKFLKQVTIESTGGFELALELTVKAHLQGYKIREIPTTWRDRTAGKSRFQLAKWLPKYLKWYAAAFKI
ncbi:MAG: glycosyltransferase family 2 protein [Candidatus Omnitrophica bacterium]|nr:glycosyltransferase family 2 protein [Candidatus Omnitrophota bacterium]